MSRFTFDQAAKIYEAIRDDLQSAFLGHSSATGYARLHRDLDISTKLVMDTVQWPDILETLKSDPERFFERFINVGGSIDTEEERRNMVEQELGEVQGLADHSKRHSLVNHPGYREGVERVKAIFAAAEPTEKGSDSLLQIGADVLNAARLQLNQEVGTVGDYLHANKELMTGGVVAKAIDRLEAGQVPTGLSQEQQEMALIGWGMREGLINRNTPFGDARMSEAVVAQEARFTTAVEPAAPLPQPLDPATLKM